MRERGQEGRVFFVKLSCLNMFDLIRASVKSSLDGPGACVSIFYLGDDVRGLLRLDCTTRKDSLANLIDFGIGARLVYDLAGHGSMLLN